VCAPRPDGIIPIYVKKWVFDLEIVILFYFLNKFVGFWSFLGDIGPFLRPDLGGKLGYGYQLQIYINQGLLKPRRTFRVGLC
jgi:hypothetical protein